jgi:hypothetical protein
MWRVEYTKRFLKDLADLPSTVQCYRTRIDKTYETDCEARKTDKRLKNGAIASLPTNRSIIIAVVELTPQISGG